jgi:AcrR family transcriptional regulator
MQRRAEQAARTRERIVDAAVELFTQRGTQGTTMNEVARVADVSPGTVLNHFATPALLLEAVVARVMANIQLPDRSIFAGTKSLTARIGVLTASMFAFYERTSDWFDLIGAELSENPVLARAEADFWRSMRRLYAEALAGTDDAVLAKTTTGLVHPATFGALRAAGLSVDEATAVVAGSITHLARTTHTHMKTFL